MRAETSTRVFVMSLAVAVVAALRLLAVSGWDPSAFTAFGVDAVEITEYAETALDREVRTRILQGHDGKFFFVQANDPWILNYEVNASVLDRPIYRSQRMLYPVLAGGAGSFAPGVIVWTLILVNVVALAAGSWAVGMIARRHGASGWWGLAFVFNVGLLSELYIDGAGILAFTLASLGALALEEERPGLAALAFAGAALTREVMLAFAGFVVIFWIIRHRKIPWLIGASPLLAVVGWALYLRSRIPTEPDVTQVKELTVVPFSGLVDAITAGRAVLSDYLLMAVFVALIVVVPLRAWKSSVYLSWGAVGFAVLAPFLSVLVWQKSFDISRALAPLVTAFLIEFALSRHRAREPSLARPTEGPAQERTGVRR